MRYDFTTLPDRSNVGSAKWNGMYRANPQVKKGVVPLSVADMEFVNPPEIMEGLRDFLTNAVLGYTSPQDKYYDAVIAWMKRRKNWDVKKEEISCSPGVIPTLYTAVRAFTKPGDKILLMTPAYPPFYAAVKRNGRTVVTTSLVNRGDHYEIDYDDMERKIADHDIHMMFLCNPHNPTGRSWRREELERIGELSLKYNVLVLSDEIHSDLLMPGVEHTVFATLSEELANNCIVCTAPSKTFNLAGMQTSNIMIHDPEKMKVFREELTTSMGGSMLNILGYEACRIAYEQCEDWLTELNQVIWENHLALKEFMRERMPKVKVFDLEGTYLQWLDFNAYHLTIEQQEELHVKKAEAFLDEGYIFGPEGNGFERVNLACPRSVLMETLERMAVAYEAL